MDKTFTIILSHFVCSFLHEPASHVISVLLHNGLTDVDWLPNVTSALPVPFLFTHCRHRAYHNGLAGDPSFFLKIKGGGLRVATPPLDPPVLPMLTNIVLVVKQCGIQSMVTLCSRVESAPSILLLSPRYRLVMLTEGPLMFVRESGTVVLIPARSLPRNMR